MAEHRGTSETSDAGARSTSQCNVPKPMRVTLAGWQNDVAATDISALGCSTCGHSSAEAGDRRRLGAADDQFGGAWCLVPKALRRHFSTGASAATAVRVARATQVTKCRKRAEGARAYPGTRALRMRGRRSVQGAMLNRRSDVKRGASEPATCRARSLAPGAEVSERALCGRSQLHGRHFSPHHVPKPSRGTSDECALSLL